MKLPPARARIPADGDRVSIVGKPGCGKTTFAARCIALDVVRDGRRALLFDPTGDVLTRLTSSSASAERVPKEWCRRVRSLADAREAARDGFWKGPGARVLQLKLDAGGDPSALAETWLEIASEKALTAGWVLCADEAQLLWPSKPSGRALAVLTLVRNYRQRLYACWQDPTLGAVVLRRNTDHACVFRLESIRSVEYGCGDWGDPELFAQCAELDRFEYLYRPPWRDDAAAPLDLYHSTDDEVPWRE